VSDQVPPKPPAPPAKPPAAPVAAGGAAKAEHKPPAAAAPSGPSDPPPPADKPVPAFITALQAAVPDGVTHVSYWVGDWTVIVPATRLLDVARHLKAAGFDFCSDVTATDWPQRPQRFDVVYSLYSIRDKRRVRIKVRAAEQERVPSVTGVWPAANWLEREVYDMFGVAFIGHPDLRRMLMPEDWQGHPQRKDYPLEGPGELLMENPLEWLKLKQAASEAEIE
jgi:NADH-quinone oxidoreductase subunit C